MFNATVELFLSQYFVITASVGKFIDNRKNLFKRLSRVFLLDDDAANKLFALCDGEAVSEIVTEQDYLRHQRLNIYSVLTGDKTTLSDEQEEIIRVKGNALTAAAKQKLAFNPEASRNAEYSALVTAANNGSLIALKIIGFLQCEGFFLDKNVDAGIKNFSKAANWNDCVATLALLHYDKSNRRYNASRLRIMVDGAPFEELGNAVKAYGITKTVDVPEVRLLNRGFNSAVLNREIYNPMSARILYGDVLSLKDKEKAMFCGNPGVLTALSDLPLKLSQRKVTAVNVAGINAVALDRPAERRKLASALNNTDLRAYEQYRPLCLVSDSPYVLNMYARAICQQTAACHIEKINVADISGYDLEPTSNNIFVRGIDEDADNRFLMFFVGNVPDKTIEFVKNFLQSARRARFHLNTPNVTLNLSAVLPICFSDKRNARQLEAYCDVVQLADVSANEMANAVSDIIEGKQTLYGVNIALQGSVDEVFADCSVDKAERLIDAVARDHRKDGETITISREAIAEYAFEGERKRIGF